MNAPLPMHAPTAENERLARDAAALALQRRRDTPPLNGPMPLDALQAVARWNVDLGVSRSIGFARNTRQVQLRLEAFNLFNTVTPGNPQTTLTSSDFGKVTSLAGGTAPRVMQLAIKYQF